MEMAQLSSYMWKLFHMTKGSHMLREVVFVVKCEYPPWSFFGYPWTPHPFPVDAVNVSVHNPPFLVFLQLLVLDASQMYCSPELVYLTWSQSHICNNWTTPSAVEDCEMGFKAPEKLPFTLKGCDLLYCHRQQSFKKICFHLYIFFVNIKTWKENRFGLNLVALSHNKHCTTFMYWQEALILLLTKIVLIALIHHSD